MGTRVVPVAAPVADMTATAPACDVMDIAPPVGASGQDRAPDIESNGRSLTRPNDASSPAHASSAAALHQPKIVQTAFIHKLYNMLEDSNIKHLISWSSNAESFVMSPSADFSKVLSQYFKHTNISSFVRQLNMYGFHKERDVFHTGNPDTLWEFKHGNGNFKRGDLMGLREIKRRASRHALVHREANYGKTSSLQPGPPTESAQLSAETPDARLANLEHSVYEVSARLQRSEDNVHHMLAKSAVASETMSRLLQVNQDLSQIVLSLIPPDNPIHHDVLSLQTEVQRQSDLLRAAEDPYETPTPYGTRQQYSTAFDTVLLSPRQIALDDTKKVGGQALPQPGAQPLYRPAVPSNLSVAARRPFGSIGGGTTAQASSPLRNAAPAPQLGPHLLPNLEPPAVSLGRRHTAADIRAHGWQAAPVPYTPSGPPAAPWPPSPNRAAPDDRRLRESLSSYSLQAASQSHPHSRPKTPPLGLPSPSITLSANGHSNGSETFGSWSWGAAAGSKDTKISSLKDSSAPPTRRGSMAHILNPSETAERSDEDEDPRGDDDRKRKRRL